MSQSKLCKCGRNLPSGWPRLLCPACYLPVERAKARGAGMAAATRGRARTFMDRKKEANRKACRGDHV